MENYIVKIKSYYQNSCLNCGTGIVIGVHEVLTAAHVISGETHVLAIEGIEIPLHIVRQNNTAVILSTDQSLPFGIAEIFSIHEILDQQTQWTVDGYITSEQQAHKIIGCGIINVGAEDDHWDCNLITIESGIACDYEGLSGAPVLSCGRIVGILQMQTPNSSGILGLQMSSVEMFRDLLNLNNMKPNEYETLILNESQSFSQGQIGRNKSNRKYIPDIFVEEGLYKERLRYFADPVLFLKKALMECKRIDFSSLNSYLSQIGSTEINNSMLPEVVLPTQIKETAEILSVFLSNTISTINCCDQDFGKRHHSIEQYYTLHCFLNNSLKYYLQDLLESIRFVCLRYLLLTKRAGQGKTNFLCDFTENFLLKKGYCTWYFNAYEFHEPPMHTLWRKLCHHDQFKSAYVNQVLERYWRRTGKPLIIVIDGLNENTSYPNFDRVMCAFLEECNALPFIKIIMSTREELLETRFSSLLHCQEQLPFFHLKMTMKSNDFDHRIFYGYLQFFGIEIRWHTLTHRTFKKLTEDVLLLRFFCEVNEHAHQLYMYDVYKYAVFEQYCVKKAQEYQQDEYVADAAELFYSLLDCICGYMIQTKTYFNIPLRIFDQNQQHLLRKMLENDVFFKDEDVIERGIHQQKSAVISFTFDEFRDYCLTNYILEHCYEREAFFLIWDELKLEQPTILEGIQKYIFYLSKTKYRDKLLPIVEALQEYDTLYWEHIWSIEDFYLTDKDLLQWKAQLLQDTAHTSQVVLDLIFRDDLSYFTTVNIRLLFEVLDEYLRTPSLYYGFTKRMFSIKRPNKYGFIPHEERSVVPFDELLEFLQQCSREPEQCQLHRELFRLSIYLYELAVPKAQALWNDLYLTTPGMVIGLLEEMNSHPNHLIQGNVKDILLGLPKRGDAYDCSIKSLCDANHFGLSFVDEAQSNAVIFGYEV